MRRGSGEKLLPTVVKGGNPKFIEFPMISLVVGTENLAGIVARITCGSLNRIKAHPEDSFRRAGRLHILPASTPIPADPDPSISADIYAVW